MDSVQPPQSFCRRGGKGDHPVKAQPDVVNTPAKPGREIQRLTNNLYQNLGDSYGLFKESCDAAREVSNTLCEIVEALEPPKGELMHKIINILNTDQRILQKLQASRDRQYSDLGMRISTLEKEFKDQARLFDVSHSSVEPEKTLKLAQDLYLALCDSYQSFKESIDVAWEVCTTLQEIIQVLEPPTDALTNKVINILKTDQRILQKQQTGKEKQCSNLDASISMLEKELNDQKRLFEAWKVHQDRMESVDLSEEKGGRSDSVFTQYVPAAVEQVNSDEVAAQTRSGQKKKIADAKVETKASRTLKAGDDLDWSYIERRKNLSKPHYNSASAGSFFCYQKGTNGPFRGVRLIDSKPSSATLSSKHQDDVPSLGDYLCQPVTEKRTSPSNEDALVKDKLGLICYKTGQERTSFFAFLEYARSVKEGSSVNKYYQFLEHIEVSTFPVIFKEFFKQFCDEQRMKGSLSNEELRTIRSFDIGFIHIIVERAIKLKDLSSAIREFQR